MRAIIEGVTEAEVYSEGKCVVAIGKGLIVLVGKSPSFETPTTR